MSLRGFGWLIAVMFCLGDAKVVSLMGISVCAVILFFEEESMERTIRLVEVVGLLLILLVNHGDIIE